MQVRSLTCRSCGGRTRLAHGEQEAACMHCGQPVRLSDAVIEEQNRSRLYPHRTPLRLGMKARFRDREYEASGRQVMRQIDEEGVTYWWEEWVLVAPDGHLLYLEFDEGKWKVSEPFIPQNPPQMEQLARCGTGGILYLEGRGATVTDSGTAQTVHAEGEFPWIITIGRSVGFVDAAGAAGFYSVEWTEDVIEFYKGHYVDERQVYIMFGLHHLIVELDRRELALRSKRNFGWVAAACGVAALVMWIAALSNPGKVVRNGTGAVQLDQVGEEGARFGPIYLSGAGRVYLLQLQGQMSQQSAWVGAALEDEQEVELVPVARDMWDESGYDSDGAWHESDLRAGAHFVLQKPGNYYVRLYAEKERTGPTGASASFTLREQVLYPVYLAVFGFISLIVGICFVLAGSPGTIQKLKESAQAASEDDD